MCIAIVKPKFAEFPTKKQFENCFNTNPHGAGFMYSDGERLIIKKGFMSFEEFINAFEQENISKDKLVFFHFRIATHGLIDEGNTHPFPLSMNVNEQRSNILNYKGYGLIHNGVFPYDKREFIKYDPTNIISDTMLLAMKLKQHLDNKSYVPIFNNLEGAIVYNLMYKDDFTQRLVDKYIGHNKLAIMNEQEEYSMFGKWIEDNGVFYSNDDYNFDYQNYVMYNNNFIYDCCVFCNRPFEQDKCFMTYCGEVCDKCCEHFKLQKCSDCGIWLFSDEIADKENILCDDCVVDYDEEEYYNHCNICCEQKEADNSLICFTCENMMQ